MKASITSILPALVLSLGACGTPDKRPSGMETDIAAWVGKPADELIAAKGPPAKTAVAADGAKTIEYLRERVFHRPSTTSVIMVLVNVGGGISAPVPHTVVEPPSTLTFSCTLSVKISGAGIVQSWKAEGNDR